MGVGGGGIHGSFRHTEKLLRRETKGEKYSSAEKKGQARRDNRSSEVEIGEDLSDLSKFSQTTHQGSFAFILHPFYVCVCACICYLFSKL